jgi:hypothetical protein
MNSRQARKLILGLIAGLFISSCGASQTKPSSTIPISTTTVVSDPALALKNLANGLNALDYSRISDSSCGKFSLVVAPDRIHFYRFEGGVWKQVDEEFGSWRPPASILVTTRDYTNDGSADFLISFGKAVPVGAIFGQIECQWQWFDIQSQTGTISKTIEGLSWSDEREVLSGTDYGTNGATSAVLLSYDMHNGAFFTEPDVVEVISNIPEECRQAVIDAPIQRSRTEKPEFNLDQLDEALRNCRSADWITVANESRSQYSSWEMEDYSYYGPAATLMKDQKAETVLRQQCIIYRIAYETRTLYGSYYPDLLACH